MKAVRKIIEHAEDSVIIELPAELRNQKLEVIILPIEITEEDKKEDVVARSYDLSSFYGKLQWKGDAVAEQRKLRDEWD